MISITNLRGIPSFQKKNRVFKRNRVFSILFLLLYIAAGVFFFSFTYFFSLANHQALSLEDRDLGIGGDEGATNVTEYSTSLYADEDGIVLVALFGIDSTTTKGRSDAIMILVVDSAHKKLKLISLPRDSYVNIPGVGMDKITHAYSYGGPQLAVKTLNTNFGLDIRLYATVNFSSLPKIVDDLGGVDLTITALESTKVPFTNGAGGYHLNGEQALEFVRIRKIDSDFERTRRQRDLVHALINEALALPFSSYPDLLYSVMPELITNLQVKDVLSLASLVLASRISGIEEMRYPQSYLAHGETIDEVYYYVFDLPTTKAQMARYIYKDQKGSGSTKVSPQLSPQNSSAQID